VATSKNKPRTVACPTCGSLVEWVVEQPWRPFCSERCKLIDLGSWFDENNHIPGDSEATSMQDKEDD
jgi:endogenous inhibitor of DNA gyrase (YacG/DUF329 family)